MPIFSGSLEEVREITHHWTTSYNEERPHQSLGNLPSAFFRQQQTQTKTNASPSKTLFSNIPLAGKHTGGAISDVGTCIAAETKQQRCFG